VSLQRLGPVLVTVGAALVLAGLLAWAGGLAWVGRLPGDVRIERGNFSLFVPFTSMILISVGLSILLNLVRRFFQ
jgi:DUF2905 family protein